MPNTPVVARIAGIRRLASVTALDLIQAYSLDQHAAGMHSQLGRLGGPGNVLQPNLPTLRTLQIRAERLEDVPLPLLVTRRCLRWIRQSIGCRSCCPSTNSCCPWTCCSCIWNRHPRLPPHSLNSFQNSSISSSLFSLPGPYVNINTQLSLYLHSNPH